MEGYVKITIFTTKINLYLLSILELGTTSACTQIIPIKY